MTMSIKEIALPLAIILMTHIGSCQASEKICTKNEAKLAEQTYGSIKRETWTWSRLYKAFSRFGHCSKGDNPGWYSAELAYAFNDAVQYLLLERWSDIGTLAEISKKDRYFFKFVLSNINDDFSQSDLETIRNLSKNSCPKNAKSICADLIKKAK